MRHCSYLSQVNLVQHNQTGTTIVINQTPKVFDCVRQWMLGNNECSRLPVALQRRRHNKTNIRFFINTDVMFVAQKVL